MAMGREGIGQESLGAGFIDMQWKQSAGEENGIGVRKDSELSGQFGHDKSQDLLGSRLHFRAQDTGKA
jgi:hypothetical protein